MKRQTSHLCKELERVSAIVIWVGMRDVHSTIIFKEGKAEAGLVYLYEQFSQIHFVRSRRILYGSKQIRKQVPEPHIVFHEFTTKSSYRSLFEFGKRPLIALH